MTVTMGSIWDGYSKYLIEELSNGTLFQQFNRIVEEDLKQRTGSYRPGWKTVSETVYSFQNDGMCSKCGESLSLHKSNSEKCPVIIDAKFIEDKPKQLSSGKRNDGD